MGLFGITSMSIRYKYTHGQWEAGQMLIWSRPRRQEPAADAALSAERMRAALPSAAGTPALLSRSCREAALSAQPQGTEQLFGCAAGMVSVTLKWLQLCVSNSPKAPLFHGRVLTSIPALTSCGFASAGDQGGGA